MPGGDNTQKAEIVLKEKTMGLVLLCNQDTRADPISAVTMGGGEPECKGGGNRTEDMKKKTDRVQAGALHRFVCNISCYFSKLGMLHLWRNMQRNTNI